MNKKMLIFFLSLICLCSIPLTCFAEEYGTEYPSYIPYSGGAYIEVQSTLGRGTLIVPDTYKTGYFGFSGSGYDLLNISNSTITGRYITNAGKVYNLRFSAYSVSQYYYESGVTREWLNLNVTKIYNTNVEFLDNTSLNRSNDIDVFDSDPFKYTVVGSLFLLDISVILLIVFSKRS